MSNDETLRNKIKEVMSAGIDADAKGLYRDWVIKHGEEAVTKWLEAHDYNTESCKSFEYAKYMADKFIDWITSGK